jgi:apolipoprotein N-acyltransferase
MNRKLLASIAAAIVIGVGLRFIVNLEPIWWLAWFLPGLLLALSLRAEPWTARGLIALSALIGVSVNMPFLLKVMPPIPMLIIMVLQTLLWVFVVSGARRIVRTFETAWAYLALPILAVAADTLLAHLTPDGNWGSLAYTQTDVLPIAQLAALGGVGAILFLLMLVNSAVALALSGAAGKRGALPVYALTAGLLVLGCGFGWLRLQTPVVGTPVSFGIASVDDYIPGADTDKSRDVWAQYEAQVLELAGSGAKLVLLPEKIDVLSSENAEKRKAQLANLARANHVWLIAGLGVDNGHERRNEAWWFAPDGRLVTNYRKHFMAPPEREFAPGNEFPVNEIDGVRYGVAICKDMHFASLGRGFGARDAGVMMVPAWDFDADAWLAADMTRLRGVENGYAVVRSSRNGLLSISDAYGRYLAVDRSTKIPGTTLFETVNVGPRVATIYTRIGDALGWLCVAAALGLIVLAFRGLTPFSSAKMGSDPI